MSMPVSVQDSSPVSCTSWERRFLPGGTCADGVFCESCLAGPCCWGGAGVSRTSCARRSCGNATATSQHPRLNSSFTLRNRIMNTGPTEQGQEASPLLADARGRHLCCPGRAAESWCEEQILCRDAEAMDRFTVKGRIPVLVQNDW